MQSLRWRALAEVDENLWRTDLRSTVCCVGFLDHVDRDAVFRVEFVSRKCLNFCRWHLARLPIFTDPLLNLLR
jgi:hypothetical protein